MRYDWNLNNFIRHFINKIYAGLALKFSLKRLSMLCMIIYIKCFIKGYLRLAITLSFPSPLVFASSLQLNLPPPTDCQRSALLVFSTPYLKIDCDFVSSHLHSSLTSLTICREAGVEVTHSRLDPASLLLQNTRRHESPLFNANISAGAQPSSSALLPCRR